MRRLIKCQCGYVVRAPSLEDLVRLAREHAREAHDMQLTDEQALAMATPDSSQHQ